jgi:hypothetical protein
VNGAEVGRKTGFVHTVVVCGDHVGRYIDAAGCGDVGAECLFVSACFILLHASRSSHSSHQSCSRSIIQQSHFFGLVTRSGVGKRNANPVQVRPVKVSDLVVDGGEPGFGVV